MTLATRYPFLYAVDDYTARVVGSRVPLSVLLRDPGVVEAALKRLRHALRGEPVPPRVSNSADEEFFSFHAAIAIASKLGRHAVSRLARAEAERAARLLSAETDDDLARIAAVAGVRVDRRPVSIPWVIVRGRVQPKILPFAVPVRAFLEAYRDSRGALTNSFLLRGRVHLDRAGLEDLLARRVAGIVEELAARYEEIEVPDEVLGKARTLEYEAEAARRSRFLPFNPSHLPPCVESALARVRERDADEVDVYLVATFLGALEVSSKDLEGIVGDPVVAEGLLALSRYAASRGYRVYRCAYLREAGRCPRDCGASSPLTAYARSLRGAGRGGDRPDEGP